VEIWRPVKGYEGLYEVSNLGRVKSVSRVIRGGRYNCDRLFKERILKQAACKGNGFYHRVQLNKDSNGRMFAVHRLVAEAFIPNPENKPEVNHVDANRFNNTVENLEWVTQEENIEHARINGLLSKSKGEDRWCAKLKETDVFEIRELHRSGKMNQKEIAKVFNVDHSNINSIIKGKTWSWLQ
jgi:hypothetical protein